MSPLQDFTSLESHVSTDNEITQELILRFMLANFKYVQYVHSLARETDYARES